MPSFTLGALNAATEWTPIGDQPITVAVDGTFVGTVSFFYRASAADTARALSRDLVGTPLQFTAPSGVLLLDAPRGEPEGQVQARMTAYTSGSAAVRIGR